MVHGSRMGRIVPRRAAEAVAEALEDTRVVLVNGARQAGKSTLVRQIGRRIGAEWQSLDHGPTRAAAQYDPAQFVQANGPMMIDEVQRVPELLLAIKETVDRDPRPGRFLLTGSARVLGMRGLPDALPGRMETVELWPLAQSEIDGVPGGFVDEAFDHGADLEPTGVDDRDGYSARIVRGGFPEAVARFGRRRERFLESYVADLVNRDVMQISEIEKVPQMRALIRLVAARSGQLLQPGSLAGELGLPQATVKRYLSLLREVFLIKTIPAWSRNVSARAVRTEKVAVVDSGVAADLLGQDERSLRRVDGLLGPLLEGFVAMEVSRQLGFSRTRADLFHYRTKDGTEVDLVLENRRGQVVAIEVKAAATVRGDDFRGIRHLADRLGDDLLLGVVLYTGDRTLPFGPRFRAMPVSALWTVG